MGRRAALAKTKSTNVMSLVAERDARALGPQIKKKFSIHDLQHVQPLNDTQAAVFTAWCEHEKNIALLGLAGTGKTYLAMYLALSTYLLNRNKYDRILIVRSVVPVRDMGHLPGEKEEKEAVYEAPYSEICSELFPWKTAWESLKESGIVEFHSTSYIRGTTWRRALVIVDECQNMTTREIHGIMTRMGEDSRLILCGDKMQSDLVKGEQTCYDFLYTIVQHMNSLRLIEFRDADMVVRSAFVREYLRARVKCNM